MTEETPESSEAPASEGSAEGVGGPNVVAAFKALPAAEKMLAIAATAALLGFILSSQWDFLFKHTWFPTCIFLGSVLCLAVIAMDLFGVKVLGHGLKMKLLLLLAVLPAIGFVVDALKNFWYALMLAGMFVMAYVGAKIGTREKIIKVTRSED
ncbi:MAG: hypothetical protein O7C98_16145 [Planctomycetota bacterium]|nr:hypothetical protein [Planctomycetota bacterium]